MSLLRSAAARRCTPPSLPGTGRTGVLPFVFAGSAASAAGGLGLLLAPQKQTGPALRMALMGAAAETVAARRMVSDAGLAGECFEQGRADLLLTTARARNAAGAALAAAGTRIPIAGRLGGAALLAASACTRFGIFAGGVASTQDPRYVVEAQRAASLAESPSTSGASMSAH